MVIIKEMGTAKRHTLADFEVFIEQPEHSEQIFELINGEIVQVPSNPYVSIIAYRIGIFIGVYLLRNKMKGHISGEAAGYLLDGNVFAPDVAFIRELPSRKGFGTVPPDLAVEVISDPKRPDESKTLRRKLDVYLRMGTVVWVVDPDARTVEVHRADEEKVVLGEEDTLTAEDILPGFELLVGDIFPDEEEEA